MALQSLCSEYLNLSTVPSISMAFQTNAILREFLMHPVNKGLIPIHYKYLRNLTMHHFLLSPVARNIHASINLASYTSSMLASHANITQYWRIFQNTQEYSSESAASPRVCHCTCKAFRGLNVS